MTRTTANGPRRGSMGRALALLLGAAACAPAERPAVPRAEGTFLRLERKGAAYAVTIANLDGPRTFDAAAAGEALTFERDGKTETIRATNGAGTGMKWLAEKTDCLVVTAGSEGFCR